LSFPSGHASLATYCMVFLVVGRKYDENVDNFIVEYYSINKNVDCKMS